MSSYFLGQLNTDLTLTPKMYVGNHFQGRWQPYILMWTADHSKEISRWGNCRIGQGSLTQDMQGKAGQPILHSRLMC